MIFIDPEEVAEAISADWLQECEEAAKEIEDAEDGDERDNVLVRRSGVWRSVKDTLSKVSYGKCWYCESKNTRSDNAVDHYRPKGRVAEEPTHTGYWWLAFDHENYRYCCTYCNSHRKDSDSGSAGGKQDHFPLADDGVRAFMPGDDLEAEKPMLIDPCRLVDVIAIWFDETGQVRLNPSALMADSGALKRVEISTRYYHLNHPRTVAERKRVYRRITSKCKAADRLFEAWQLGDASLKERYEDAIKELSRLLTRTSEFSAVAHCAIKGLREASYTAFVLSEVKL